MADQLVEELWNDEGLKEKEAKKIEKKNYDFEYNMSSNYEEYNVFVPDERQVEENIEDESQPNLGKKIQIDLMKMVHHGVDYNNTTYFLTSLNPKTVVITGPQSFFNNRMKQCLSGTKVYSTMTDSAAIVAEFSKSGIDTKYNKIISGTEEIDGETYWFDENGRSITGWKYFDNAWHYYNEKGILETGWKTINGSLYYMNPAGIMLTGWKYIDGIWYYFHWSGPMQTGWQYINSAWYLLDATGAMQTGWQLVGGNWFYMEGSGAMATGWRYIAGSWYYMDDSGARVNNCWYWVGTNCYYFNENGEMVANTWIGDWYVDESGAWIPGKIKPKNEWIYQSGRWWYRHADGSYTRDGWERIGNTQYYFDGSGWMITGWKYSEGIWYYMNDSGAMISNCWYWIGTNCYYFNENGEMAADAWIGDWYVDGSGAWIPEKVYDK